MGIRAYKTKRQVNNGNSFNLDYTPELLEKADSLYDQYNELRYIELTIETIKEYLDNKNIDKQKYVIDNLTKDIAEAEKDGEDFILYECY